MDNLIEVGTLSDMLANYIHVTSGLPIYQSTGLRKHIAKRHPDCLKYLDQVSVILSSPDYIGINPNEKGVTCELVKVLDDNVQLGMKLESGGGYWYVATLHTITEAKLQRRIVSGRLMVI